MDDHDLLVRIDERLKSVVDAQTAFIQRLEEVWYTLDRHSAQLADLRAAQDHARGFVGGARWLWGVLVTVPAAVAGALFARNT